MSTEKIVTMREAVAAAMRQIEAARAADIMAKMGVRNPLATKSPTNPDAL